jgi:protein-S-isoprenylcysteine O-methyltransferase Ste14
MAEVTLQSRNRADLVRRGRYLEYFTIGYNSLEGLIAVASWRIGIDQSHRTNLVQSGVFSLSRNPIFLGMMLTLFGLFLVPKCFDAACPWARCRADADSSAARRRIPCQNAW